MFTGFTDETFEFFMAIRFNNNKAFFHESYDWYLRAVRQPALALAEALAPAAEALDESLERRPGRVVSRINRDIRFTKDKSPYRDHIFLAFRRPGEERRSSLGAYFEIDESAAFYGMGFYGENRPLMNALRRRMREGAEEFLPLASAVTGEFALNGPVFKRMAVPPEVPEALREWYPRRGFYVEKRLPLALARTPELVEEVAGGFRRLKPLYDYIQSCPLEEETT